MFFKERSDVLHRSNVRNNAEILDNMNTAIKSLYALDVGAFSANGTLNNPVDVDKMISELLPDFGMIAGKLEIIRSLAFGYSLDWDSAQSDLEWTAREYEAKVKPAAEPEPEASTDA